MSFVEELTNVEDVKESLNNLAVVQNVDINSIDFSIIDTKFKLFYSDGRNETLNSYEFKMRVDEHLSSTKVTQIKELYDVEFFYSEDGFLKNQYFSLFVSKQKTKCAIKVLHEPKFVVDMQEYLLKLLAYNGVLTLYGVDEAVKNMKDKEINIDDKILISKSLLPQPPKDEHLEFKFDPNKDEEDFTEIEKGDEILRIYRGVEGKAGRDLYGNVINVRKPNALNDELTFNEESVVKLKNKKYDTLYAKVKGFISYEDNYLDVSNRMVMKGTNQQKAGELGTDIQNEVAIEIIQESDADDSVNAGIKIKTHAIDTAGSIGKNVDITTESANIDGHTHISSRINAKEATIATLRGNLESESATINEIINATVKVTLLKAQIALGSKIDMKQGEIKDVRNNNTIHISKELEVEKISGNSNRFVLLIDDGSEMKHEIDELQNDTNVMKKSEVVLKSKLKTLIPQAKKIQEKLAQKIELSQLEKKTILSVKESKQKVVDLMAKIKENEEKIEEMQNDMEEKSQNKHDVVILNHSRSWGKDNKFEVMTEKGLVSHVTDGSERGKKVQYDEPSHRIVFA
jgi:hypothetical protein